MNWVSIEPSIASGFSATSMKNRCLHQLQDLRELCSSCSSSQPSSLQLSAHSLVLSPQKNNQANYHESNKRTSLSATGLGTHSSEETQSVRSPRASRRLSSTAMSTSRSLGNGFTGLTRFWVPRQWAYSSVGIYSSLVTHWGGKEACCQVIKITVGSWILNWDCKKFVDRHWSLIMLTTLAPEQGCAPQTIN